ncbi:ComF family protein [Hymenobacter busanensis]|uniref:ComF family protein n=1 Tax=Hymenobacter busanensis TaxID=2607656 RepID=A0A7L4ZYQ1_9BACT|nr:ComF family protein [Hymenobacter busanensis]KAA9332968.1 ComF family protein [Hymenobacter busanensis]QHJ08358.1 ComF family protein [Hymenobacter busanensis]
MLQTALSDFVSLIFPHTCLACQQPLARGETHICTGCRTQLPYTDYHRLSPTDNPLLRRFWGRVPVHYALSYLRFLRRGRVQHLLHQLKYQGQREVGSALGLMYGQELADSELVTGIDLIVPVPLHPRKLAKRGYNQSDSFAEGLAQSLQVPWSATGLHRTSYTVSQTRKTRAERWENVADVFGVSKPDTVQGQHVLVVDDVLTTGATLEACAIKLLDAGAAKVSIATIACADR